MNLSISSTRSVEGRIASNAGLLFGAKALGATFGLITLIVTERALDSIVDFGIIIFLHGYMLFFAEMMTFQPWQAVIRFGSDDVEADDGKRFAKLINFCAQLDALAAVLAYLAAIALFGVVVSLIETYPNLWPGSDQIDPASLFGLVALYCTVVLFNQTGMSTGVLRLFDRFVGLALSWLVMPTLRLAGALVAAWQGWGVMGFIAVWYGAALARYLVIIALGLWELSSRGLLRESFRRRTAFLRPREGLWAFATKAYVDSSLAAGFSHLPVLLVMSVFGPVFVPIYKIGEEIARLLSEGVKLLDQVIYPELARIIAAGQGRRVIRLVVKASAVSLSVGLLLSAVVYIFAPYLVNASVGAEYALSVDLAVLLVIGAAIFAAVAPLYPVFYAVGRPERAIYARGVGILAYIVSFVFLTRWLGEIGTAWAWIAGYTVALVAVVLLVLATLKDLDAGRAS